MVRKCKAFKNIVDRYSLVDAFFQVFYICVIGKQHLEDCEWNGVRSGNTVVSFWSFSLFWCGIEEWFFVSLSVAVGADTAMFFSSVSLSSV